MNAALIDEIFGWLQVVLGLSIMLSGVALSATGCDGQTRRMVRWSLIGLVMWGAWLGLLPLTSCTHDSPPSLAFAALVAYVLMRHGRQVRGILDGEWWWPPNLSSVKPSTQTVHMRPGCVPRRWWVKINPLWLLFGNDDDGYYGDDAWRAGRKQTLKLAVIWWLRNPFHNLFFYGIGVTDRERLNVGRFAPNIYQPGGGLLTCWTELQAGPLWLTLPFISYLSPHIKAYAGWRPSGALGFKLNISFRGTLCS